MQRIYIVLLWNKLTGKMWDYISLNIVLIRLSNSQNPFSVIYILATTLTPCVFTFQIIQISTIPPKQLPQNIKFIAISMINCNSSKTSTSSVVLYINIDKPMNNQKQPRVLLRQPSFNRQQSYAITSQNQSDILHTLQPTVSYTHLHEKDLSLRSISSNKRSRLSAITPRTYDNDITHSHISESAKYKYETIERILKNQNHNLKKQNELLQNQVQRLKCSNKKYKETCLRQRIQTQALRQQCEAQKQRAQEMKEIIMTRLIRLQEKAIGGTGEGLTPQQREDLMNALNSSDIQKDQ